MATPWIAALFALFIWWFSTGAILYVVRRAENRPGCHGRAVMWGLPALVAGTVATTLSLSMPSVAGVYLGFLGALAIWGWIELAFLTGIVTGPNRTPLAEGHSEWGRFLKATGTVAYHEALLLAGFLTLVLAAPAAENTIAAWTFGVLYIARISAKLNLYFVAVVVGVQALGVATSPAETAGIALVTALTALALLEHWLMVLPLPDARLWRWMLPEPKAPQR
jgi:putative photosynthetic complex assembly protein 2